MGAHASTVRYCGCGLAREGFSARVRLFRGERNSHFTLHFEPVRMGQISSFFQPAKITVVFGTRNDSQVLTLDFSDFIDIVDISIGSYPKTTEVEKKEMQTCPLVVNYICNNEHQCDFTQCIKDITAAELKEQELTKSIIQAIANNPNRFPSSGLNGYIFQSFGQSCIHLRNTTIPALTADARVGLLDLVDVKKRLSIEAHHRRAMAEKLETIGAGVLLGMALLSGASWIGKRVKYVGPK